MQWPYPYRSTDATPPRDENEGRSEVNDKSRAEGQSPLNDGLGRTASSINIEMMVTRNAWNRLVMYPDQQARAIAEHYAAHYQLARELLMALDARRDMFGGDTTNVDKLIDHLVRQIKQNHRASLGIELEWPNV